MKFILSSRKTSNFYSGQVLFHFTLFIKHENNFSKKNCKKKFRTRLYFFFVNFFVQKPISTGLRTFSSRVVSFSLIVSLKFSPRKSAVESERKTRKKGSVPFSRHQNYLIFSQLDQSERPFSLFMRQTPMRHTFELSFYSRFFFRSISGDRLNRGRDTGKVVGLGKCSWMWPIPDKKSVFGIYRSKFGTFHSERFSSRFSCMRSAFGV